MVGASDEKGYEIERGVRYSKPLHNTRTPSRPKQGHQEKLRCINISHHDPSRSPIVSNSAPNSTAHLVDHHQGQATSTIPVHQNPIVAATHKNVKGKSQISTSTSVDEVYVGDTNRIGAIGQNLTSDIKMSTDGLKPQIFEDTKKDSNNNKKPPKEVQQRVLRLRGPSGKVSNEVGIDNVCLSPLNYMQERGLRSLLASDKGMDNSGSEKQQIPKLFTALSKEEIEIDFLLMTGNIPPVKPNRRSEALQKQLNKLLPGSSLVDVRSWTYEVLDHLRKPKD